MKIAIFGLGYVGAVTGACLAENGFEVCIIERDSQKVALFMSGRSPISEPGLEILIKKGIESKRLRATIDHNDGLGDANIVLVSVGTPTNPETGAADLRAIKTVANEISQNMIATGQTKAIAICSTVPPGTTESIFRSALIEANVPEIQYSLSFIPEFLREGSAISDYQNPTRFIIGVRKAEEAAEFLRLRMELSEITHVVRIEVAEMLKVVENSWHATKITFTNEVARICDGYQIDASQVMDLLIKDTRQNISAAYLHPGFAYGGSCLPKDLRSLNYLASAKQISTPLLSRIEISNDSHIEYAARKVISFRPNRVAILGLAFKAKTDDMRESPSLKLISRLAHNEIEMRIHDFEIRKDNLIGVNGEIWEANPFLETSFDTNPQHVLANADLVVVAQYDKRYEAVLLSIPSDIPILNLVML